jgi:uncharacterized protein
VVSETSLDLPQAPSGWVTLPDVAQRMDVPITKVHQMLKDGTLLAVRRDGVKYVPADTLPGTPAEALAADGATEVKRRAQALAL